MSYISPALPKSRPTRQRAIAAARAGFDTDAALERIRAVYGQATDQEVRAGLLWYECARMEAETLAQAHGVTVRTAVGIVAALSPGCPWDRNIPLAATMLATGDCAHPYGDAIRKARRILNGEDPTHVLKGRKVRSFYHNILYPATSQAVTIDRHALAIVTATEQGKRGASVIDYKWLKRPGAYQMVAACYRTVARELDMLPSELQAITWLVWRRLTDVPEF